MQVPVTGTHRVGSTLPGSLDGAWPMHGCSTRPLWHRRHPAGRDPRRCRPLTARPPSHAMPCSSQPRSDEAPRRCQPLPRPPHRPSSAPPRPTRARCGASSLAFLGPMVLGNILQALSGTFNNVFVGQMLGTQALAAVAGGVSDRLLLHLAGDRHRRRRLGADRPGLGRARDAQGQGDRRHRARARAWCSGWLVALFGGSFTERAAAARWARRPTCWPTRSAMPA